MNSTVESFVPCDDIISSSDDKIEKEEELVNYAYKLYQLECKSKLKYVDKVTIIYDPLFMRLSFSSIQKKEHVNHDLDIVKMCFEKHKLKNIGVTYFVRDEKDYVY